MAQLDHWIITRFEAFYGVLLDLFGLPIGTFRFCVFTLPYLVEIVVSLMYRQWYGLYILADVSFVYLVLVTTYDWGIMRRENRFQKNNNLVALNSYSLTYSQSCFLRIFMGVFCVLDFLVFQGAAGVGGFCVLYALCIKLRDRDCDRFKTRTVSFQ